MEISEIRNVISRISSLSNKLSWTEKSKIIDELLKIIDSLVNSVLANIYEWRIDNTLFEIILQTTEIHHFKKHAYSKPTRLLLKHIVWRIKVAKNLKEQKNLNKWTKNDEFKEICEPTIDEIKSNIKNNNYLDALINIYLINIVFKNNTSYIQERHSILLATFTRENISETKIFTKRFEIIQVEKLFEQKQ